MPFIQITIGEGHDEAVKRELLAGVSRVASEVTGTPETAFRLWIVELPATEIMVGGAVLADTRKQVPR